ncbi:cation:proton antiporter domain-containing protein [Sandarakinorhabdus oryzae]|uniref:cation:proton antiporter domain-containing protein n=1 Tax=Sandarakinorhabdus oryzae TaxID=2675220 RepID=UPI0012E0F759|nr:cation:proton antiporter [Sandarakinorhabdus oryzae]
MALNLESTAFKDMVLVLGAAGLVIPAFAALRISPVIGFILIGVAAGPFGLGQLPGLEWLALSNPESLAAPAELGVALLLFALGLELSLDRIRIMRSLILGFGSQQLLLCGGLIAAVLVFAGLPLLPVVALATAMALSSTAVGLQLLSASGRVNSQAGRKAVGVLLFQDLALAPVLLLIGAGSGGNFGRSLAIGIGALIGIALFARHMVPPLFLQAARTRRSELFLAAALVVLIGSAATAAAAGLSPAVGALTAGLMLSASDYRRQIEAAIQPFEGLLLGVFLIWVGSGLDLAAIAADPWPVLAGTAIVLSLKAGAVYGLLRLQGTRRGVAGHVALLLASPSETSLIVLAAATSARLIGGSTAEMALAVASLTLALAPLLGLAGARLEAQASEERDDPPADHAAGQTVIIGFGRVGRLVAQMLDMHGQPWMAVDSDPDEVQRLKRGGKPVIYGDARRPELVDRLKLDQARAVVLTIDDMRMLDLLIRRIRLHHPDLCIVVRARDADHAAMLYAVGATDAVPETVESSLQLAEAVLVDLGVPMGPVIASIHEKRDELRAQIKSGGTTLKRPPLRTLRRGPAKGD